MFSSSREYTVLLPPPSHFRFGSFSLLFLMDQGGVGWVLLVNRCAPGPTGQGCPGMGLGSLRAHVVAGAELGSAWLSQLSGAPSPSPRAFCMQAVDFPFSALSPEKSIAEEPEEGADWSQKILRAGFWGVWTYPLSFRPPPPPPSPPRMFKHLTDRQDQPELLLQRQAGNTFKT